MFVRKLFLAALAMLVPLAAGAATRCDAVLAAFGNKLVDATCFEKGDLTTNGDFTDANLTTPANNSIAGLPPGAFTPNTDRNVISPNPPNRTPITKVVPGIQLDARFADDPTGEARFLIRLPDDWNGNLVVAGASGTRSEFNGDFAWSDYVVQKGYAYASQNKGVLNLKIVSLSSPLPPASDPAPCRLNPASSIWVHFFDNDPEKPFTQWTQYMIEGAQFARQAVKANYHHYPTRTYAVGTSNGGYQVRRAIEEAPDLFDGGVDWEGTFIDPSGPNILIDLPPAIKNFPDYVASGFNPNSAAAQNIVAAGYPPDIVLPPVPPSVTPRSLWANYWAQFWEVTQCQWQKRFDPTWQTYFDGLNDVTGTGGYDYFARAALDPSIVAQLGAVATTGKIKKPLITVAGTMDALLPIKRGARAYEAVVNASRNGNNDQREAQYRLYEVQNGNHIETFKNPFTQLEFIQPHAQKAFDLLVDHVENNAALPPSQCIARGAAITAAPTPAQAGHCADLLAP
ncbi:MAG: tannase/feruloyl esterase family alpha/beta hydrolase [Betaproteobacteria bacterium]|nr:MAG: tannase/feruloyl esterase family alpha/beta hydrolase [Betaproteobacteria bacterium]